jgi:DNA-binding NtrC family response regulator
MMPTAKPSSDDLLGDSQPACTLREAIARAARAPFPVLIQGGIGPQPHPSFIEIFNPIAVG